jgi:hypothetical protein
MVPAILRCSARDSTSARRDAVGSTSGTTTSPYAQYAASTAKKLTAMRVMRGMESQAK